MTAAATQPVCPSCGEPMTGGGAAIVCGPGGTGGTIPLPRTCRSVECRKKRDAEAIASAIERGIIDP